MQEAAHIDVLNDACQGTSEVIDRGEHNASRLDLMENETTCDIIANDSLMGEDCR